MRLLRSTLSRPSPLKGEGLGEGFELSMREADKRYIVAVNKFKE